MTLERRRELAHLGRLPNPLHLFASLTGSQHYHFGFHVGEDSAGSDKESLARAMDRLCLRCAEFLPDASQVLDVGCGMGGTVSLLASLGHQVVGVDPCEHSIAYARSVLEGGPRHRFLSCALEGLAALLPEERFDALILVEVAHRFSSLDTLLAISHGLLRPGGVIVLQDVAHCGNPESLAIPFHERGSLARLAESTGFLVQHQGELTGNVAPTLGCLTERLHAERQRLIDRFQDARPGIAGEIEELHVQLEHLALGFATRRLVYEEIVLRSRASTAP